MVWLFKLRVYLIKLIKNITTMNNYFEDVTLVFLELCVKPLYFCCVTSVNVGYHGFYYYC